MLNAVAAFPECLAQPNPEDPDLKSGMLELFVDLSPQVKALMMLPVNVMVGQVLGSKRNDHKDELQ